MRGFGAPARETPIRIGFPAGPRGVRNCEFVTAVRRFRDASGGCFGIGFRDPLSADLKDARVGARCLTRGKGRLPSKDSAPEGGLHGADLWVRPRQLQDGAV